MQCDEVNVSETEPSQEVDGVPTVLNSKGGMLAGDCCGKRKLSAAEHSVGGMFRAPLNRLTALDTCTPAVAVEPGLRACSPES